MLEVREKLQRRGVGAKEHIGGHRTAPNPLTLTAEEATRIALDDNERERFESVLRRALEAQMVTMRRAVVFFTATKARTDTGATDSAADVP